MYTVFKGDLMNKYNDFKILDIDFECSSCKKVCNDNSKIPVKRIIEKLDDFFNFNDLLGAEKLLEFWQKEAKAKSDLKGELSVVNEMLGLYRKTNNPQKADNAISRACELLELTNNSSTLSGATIMLNTATTCKAFGKLEKAIPLYKKASEIYHRVLPKDDLKIAALYNNYATALVDLEDFAKAEELYIKAIKITEKDLKSLLDCAVTYVNLAHLYEQKDGIEAKDIEKSLSKAEEIFENKNIERNSYYAFVSEKCAPSFDYFGYFIFANELYKRSREIYERA